MGETVVGVVANPASGRDVRRLVTGASVFDNAEKGSMVHRLMAGLGAAGVDRVVMMPASAGVSESLRRHLRGRTGRLAGYPLPALDFLTMTMRDSASDTAAAVATMVADKVSALVVLGGDGTHRIVAGHCGDVPVCALSTGTNNAFPRMLEATVAGLATGLVATGRLGGERILRREKLLRVTMGDGSVHHALVDAALVSDRWTAARALWRPEGIAEFVVAFAEPSALGLSGVAGQLEPLARTSPGGMHVRLTDPECAATVVTAALAPGLVVPLGVAEARHVDAGQPVLLERRAGCVALDGERELELGAGGEVEVTVGTGPLTTIDVDATMAEAARLGLLRS